MNRIFLGAIVVFAAWLGGLLWFVYVWLPNYVSGEVVQMPDFSGMSASEARAAAESAGIAINYEATEERHDSSIPRGHVITHVPRPGQNVKRSRPVRFAISLGPERVAVPQVAGTTIREAQYELQLRGLQLDREVYTYDDHQRAQAIIATAPEEGAPVPWGTAVNVLISVGPRPLRVPMPRVVGLPLSEAEKTLGAHRLRVGKIDYRADARAGAEEVLAQSPDADSVVASGSRVSLTVNQRGSRQRETSGLYIIEHTVGGSPERDVHVKIEIRDGRGTHVVVNAFQQGGARISLPWNVSGAARLVVYEDDMRTPVREERLQ